VFDPIQSLGYLHSIAAIAFSYFEVLQAIGNQSKFNEERVRLKSLEKSMLSIGYQEYLIEDFVDEFMTLLEQIQVPNDNGASILAAFNDEHRSLAIIAYVKVRWSSLCC
jgi:ubiquitin thioesterase protein OTUB1